KSAKNETDFERTGPLDDKNKTDPGNLGETSFLCVDPSVREGCNIFRISRELNILLCLSTLFSDILFLVCARLFPVLSGCSLDSTVFRALLPMDRDILRRLVRVGKQKIAKLDRQSPGKLLDRHLLCRALSRWRALRDNLGRHSLWVTGCSAGAFSWDEDCSFESVSSLSEFPPPSDYPSSPVTEPTTEADIVLSSSACSQFTNPDEKLYCPVN
ncbi:hypothetical protein T265_13482, partial [Opisthorchis viverrini]